MSVTNIFSGLLAAVMVALGAGQIGNKNTQVGEELVVEERVKKDIAAPLTRQATWFIYTSASPANATTAMQPSNYELHDEILHGPLCNESSQYCAVLAPPQGGSPTSPDLSGSDIASQEAVEAIESFFNNKGHDASLIRLKN